MDIYAIYALDVCVCEWNGSLKASRTPHQDDRLFLEQGLKFRTPPLQYMDVHGTMLCFGSSIVPTCPNMLAFGLGRIFKMWASPATGALHGNDPASHVPTRLLCLLARSLHICKQILQQGRS